VIYLLNSRINPITPEQNELVKLTINDNAAIHRHDALKIIIMKNNLSKVKSELETYASESNLTELQIVDKLKDYYFNKEVNENLKLYKKRNKKVSEITKDLKISPRRFYAILEKKKVEHTKYKKAENELK
jgi:hypothetical protein